MSKDVCHVREMEAKGSWLERPGHRDSQLRWCHLLSMSHTGHIGQNRPAPLSHQLTVALQKSWLGAGEERELRGASFSIIHSEISADGAGAFRGWFLMEPADVSGQ